MKNKLVVWEWLYKADQDFGYAMGSLGSEELPYYDQICFLFQQAAEKYLKAYIVANELKFEKQHNLIKLLSVCLKKDPVLGELREDCRLLTPFYFESRYPDEHFVVATKKQAQDAGLAAGRIQLKIRECLQVDGEITRDMLTKEDKLVEEKLGN